jgi:hypothetical protein
MARRFVTKVIELIESASQGEQLSPRSSPATATP